MRVHVGGTTATCVAPCLRQWRLQAVRPGAAWPASELTSSIGRFRPVLPQMSNLYGTPRSVVHCIDVVVASDQQHGTPPAELLPGTHLVISLVAELTLREPPQVVRQCMPTL